MRFVIGSRKNFKNRKNLFLRAARLLRIHSAVGGNRVRASRPVKGIMVASGRMNFTSGDHSVATAETGSAPLRIVDTVVASKGVLSSPLGEEVMILDPDNVPTSLDTGRQVLVLTDWGNG